MLRIIFHIISLATTAMVAATNMPRELEISTLCPLESVLHRQETYVLCNPKNHENNYGWSNNKHGRVQLICLGH